jgi:hypothetical protein
VILPKIIFYGPFSFKGQQEKQTLNGKERYNGKYLGILSKNKFRDRLPEPKRSYSLPSLF